MLKYKSENTKLLSRNVSSEGRAGVGRLGAWIPAWTGPDCRVLGQDTSAILPDLLQGSCDHTTMSVWNESNAYSDHTGL